MYVCFHARKYVKTRSCVFYPPMDKGLFDEIIMTKHKIYRNLLEVYMIPMVVFFLAYCSRLGASRICLLSVESEFT